MKVHEAMTKVMEDVRAVGKGDRNQQQGFDFRGIDAVVNAVGPQLRKHGVVVVPAVQSVDRTTVEVGIKRTLMGHVAVIVQYRFFGPEGDFIDCVTPGEAMDSGDKATAKAMSVAFRTALLQALALPTTEKDPDAEVYERAPVAPQVVTDKKWFEDAKAGLNEASDAAGLATALEFIQKDVRTKCSDEDAATLRTAYLAREKELAK